MWVRRSAEPVFGPFPPLGEDSDIWTDEQAVHDGRQLLQFEPLRRQSTGTWDDFKHCTRTHRLATMAPAGQCEFVELVVRCVVLFSTIPKLSARWYPVAGREFTDYVHGGLSELAIRIPASLHSTGCNRRRALTGDEPRDPLAFSKPSLMHPSRNRKPLNDRTLAIDPLNWIRRYSEFGVRGAEGTGERPADGHEGAAGSRNKVRL